MFNYMLFVLHFFFNEYRKPFKLPCFKIYNKINNGINWLWDCCTAPQLMNLSPVTQRLTTSNSPGKKTTYRYLENSGSSIEMPSSINLAVFLLTVIQFMMIRRIARESERKRRAALVDVVKLWVLAYFLLPF